MAKATRRRTKKATRTPRQPKIKEPEFLPAETHLRHNVLSMLHQHGQSVDVTISEAKKALAFILDKKGEGDSNEAVFKPIRTKRHDVPEQPLPNHVVADYKTVTDELPHRKHFDVENLDM